MVEHVTHLLEKIEIINIITSVKIVDLRIVKREVLQDGLYEIIQVVGIVHIEKEKDFRKDKIVKIFFRVVIFVQNFINVGVL